MRNTEKFLKDRREMIKRGEGCIGYMYLDTVGKVTVGVGNMLPKKEAAEELPFIIRETGSLATKNEIFNEFNVIKKQRMALLASRYKKYTKLDLSKEAIDRLLDSRINEFEAVLRNDFTEYDTFPDVAKLGLMDMAFNLGNRGLIKKFPTFTRYTVTKDWANCAKQCHRRGISEARNKEVEGLFSYASYCLVG